MFAVMAVMMMNMPVFAQKIHKVDSFYGLKVACQSEDDWDKTIIVTKSIFINNFNVHTINIYGNVTLDLGDCYIQYWHREANSSSRYLFGVYSGNTLTITSSSDDKKGRISASGYTGECAICYVSGGELIIDGGTLGSSNTPYYEAMSKTYTYPSTIKVEDAGKVIIKSGSVTSQHGYALDVNITETYGNTANDIPCACIRGGRVYSGYNIDTIEGPNVEGPNEAAQEPLHVTSQKEGIMPYVVISGGTVESYSENGALAYTDGAYIPVFGGIVPTQYYDKGTDSLKALPLTPGVERTLIDHKRIDDVLVPAYKSTQPLYIVTDSFDENTRNELTAKKLLYGKISESYLTDEMKEFKSSVDTITVAPYNITPIFKVGSPYSEDDSYTFTWYVSDDNLAYTQAGTDKTFTIPRPSGAVVKYIKLVAGNGSTSKISYLKVEYEADLPTKITEQPVSRHVSLIGDETEFSITAENAKSYQWYCSKNGTVIDWDTIRENGWCTTPIGTNKDRLHLSNVHAEMHIFNVYCVVSGTDTLTSDRASLTVGNEIGYINDITIENLENCCIGDTPAGYKIASVPQNKSYTVGEAVWEMPVSGKTYTVSDSDTLEADTTYAVTVPVYAKEGYTLADNFKGQINDISYYLSRKTSDTEGSLIILFQPAVPENGIKISSVSREITAPAVGNTPDKEFIGLSSGKMMYIYYTVEDVNWIEKNGDTWENITSDVFEEGKIYKTVVKLKANTDYGFYPDTVFKINDKDAVVESLVQGSGGTAIVSLTFDNGEEIETDFVYGDANANGGLQAADAAYVLQKVLNGNFQMPIEEKTTDWLGVVDVNASGNLSAEDSAMILQKVLNSGFTMPAEQ